jgi:hypothetical protein
VRCPPLERKPLQQIIQLQVRWLPPVEDRFYDVRREQCEPQDAADIGGVVVTPDRAEWAPRPRVDNAMIKALARAFRWRKMLDTGVYATLDDLAKAKSVNATYISRILR